MTMHTLRTVWQRPWRRRGMTTGRDRDHPASLDRESGSSVAIQAVAPSIDTTTLDVKVKLMHAPSQRTSRQGSRSRLPFAV